MNATWIDGGRAELRVPGTAPVLICDYSGVTGEWTPTAISIDGEIKSLSEMNLPPCFTLNSEAFEALEALA